MNQPYKIDTRICALANLLNPNDPSIHIALDPKAAGHLRWSAHAAGVSVYAPWIMDVFRLLEKNLCSRVEKEIQQFEQVTETFRSEYQRVRDAADHPYVRGDRGLEGLLAEILVTPSPDGDNQDDAS